MNAARLADVYADLNAETLRELFLEVVRVLPDARDVTLHHLYEERSNLQNRRTVSLDNLVSTNSNFQISAPAKRKVKPRKTKGHHFITHNYAKPTICCVCGLALDGIMCQGVQCKHCLLDVHKHCIPDLASCQGNHKRKKKSKTNQPNPKGKIKAHRPQQTLTVFDDDTTVNGSTVGGTTDDEFDPTYIEALPQSPKDHTITESIATTERDVYDTPKNSSDEEEDNHHERNSSDDEQNSSDYDDEINSSDGESEEGDGKDLTIIKEEDVDGDEATSKETPQSTFGGLQVPSIHKGADWTKHSKSFKMRLQNSKPLDKTTIKIITKDISALDKEFEDIPQNRVNIVAMPKLTEGKNRYMNVLPNNHSRVLLKQIGDDETTEYINANWMNGYGEDGKQAYIACQGPLPETVFDFWRMVWEHDVHVIVMNTNFVEGPEEIVKCQRYWPESPTSDPMVVEDFSIKSEKEDRAYPQFIITDLSISRNGETREVRHLWWTDWPDKGVPKTANGIGNLIHEARNARKKLGGPAVIHCSAGIGRTGCFLAIDYCMQQYDTEERIDILKCVCQMRQSRGMTVQTAAQYRFIHSVMQKYTEGDLMKNEDKETESVSDKVEESGYQGLRISRKNRPLSFQLSRGKSRTRILKGRSSSGDGPSPPLLSKQKSAERFALKEATAGGSVECGEHSFKYKTFVKPTKCDICEALLQGLALQGVRCSVCKRNVHVDCLESVPKICERVTNVKRQPSGLPSWPPNRSPTKTKFFPNSLPEGDET
eukprot:m.110748 g.110748  ORF g.110748 m.110748 type:complete len:767 (-) comp14049_c0_seq7:1348-3648(-)